MMGGVAKVLISPFAAALGAFKKPKAATPTPVASATPRRSAVLDALQSRRGTLANNRTGEGGAESATGKKSALGG
jgi:hypothetical protein